VVDIDKFKPGKQNDVSAQKEKKNASRPCGFGASGIMQRRVGLR
jgi:hypothetical protein